MRSFMDKQGEFWNIELTIGAVRRVKSELGLDLFDVDQDRKDSSLATVQCDLETFLNLIEVLCREQITARGLTDPYDFAARFNGEVLGAAREALMGEWSDFFLESGLKVQAALIRKFQILMAASQEELIKRAETVPIEELIDQALQSASGSSFGATPASSG